jgi:amidase
VVAEVQEWSISELQALLESGKLTSRQLVEMYLERIASFDSNGPRLNAVLELNPEALDIAGRLDAERRAGSTRGALHGVPVLVKDNIDTHDRMQTTSGSLALEGHYAGRDAFLVERLRAAGALILGKTNLSEWANFRGKPSVSGWSSRGGLTRNPYALDRSACGSSSGSGAAVAANLCAASVGTETDGSVICPAQTNGIVGLKPTLGLISRSGIIPIAHSQDTAGPMGRTVEDVAILLGAMTGVDRRDQATAGSREYALADYRSNLDSNGLRGARIGVARNMAGSDRRVLAVFERSLEVMRAAGAELIDPADVANFDKFGKSEIEVLLYEFKADLDAYLSGVGLQVAVHSMKEVIQFNENNRERVMPYFGQERMEAAVKKGPLTHKKYLNALARNLRLARKEGLDATLEKFHLDAIVVPSGGPAWTIDLVNGDALSWDMESTSPPAVAGYPHVTVPSGYIYGLPVGISFIARAWQEPTLLRLAYAFEQKTRVRKPPEFLTTIDLDGEAVTFP